jgi:hypothetical protein
MCVPTVFIRDDGKGFVVRRGGIDLNVREDADKQDWVAYANGYWGCAQTIMEAVDNALAKIAQAEINEASIQEGEKE